MIDKTGTSTGNTLATLLRSAGRTASSSTANTDAADAETAAAPTNVPPDAGAGDNVDLSDMAKSLLQQASSTVEALGVPASLRDRTNNLATKLTNDFKALKISQGSAITFKIDASGAIEASGAEADKIEKYFQDNPEVAEQFKALSALHTMSAMQDVIRAYNAEKRSAGGDKDKQANAWDNYALRSMQVQSLSGAFQLKDGQLTSATTEYAATMQGAAPSPGATMARGVTDISV